MLTLEQAFSVLGTAAVSRFLTLAEKRREILYSERDCRVGGQFGRRLSKLSEDKREKIPTVYRKAFLWGCTNFLTKLDHEMIVVGFSRTLGTRNAVDSALKIPGQRHAVILLPDELAEIHAHLNAAKNNSILLVHNHPDHVIHTVLAMLMAVPLGLGAAIYISEFSTGRVRETLPRSTFTATGMPSPSCLAR